MDKQTCLECLGARRQQRRRTVVRTVLAKDRDGVLERSIFPNIQRVAKWVDPGVHITTH